MQVQAGAPRYDLHGNRVGTVTPDEESVARRKLEDVYAQKNEAAKQKLDFALARKQEQDAQINRSSPGFTSPMIPAPERVPVTTPISAPSPASFTGAERNYGPERTRFEYNGEKFTTSELIQRFGSRVPYNVLYQRLKIGWDVHRALTTPVMAKRYRHQRFEHTKRPTFTAVEPSTIIKIGGDERLALARKRIEAAEGMVTIDRDVALIVLRTALEPIQQTIEAWTGKSEN